MTGSKKQQNKMPIIECSKSDEFKKHIEDGPCIVDFSATWCKKPTNYIFYLLRLKSKNNLYFSLLKLEFSYFIIQK